MMMKNSEDANEDEEKGLRITTSTGPMMRMRRTLR